MESKTDTSSSQTHSSLVLGALVGFSTLVLAGGLGLWTWMNRWERQYMLLSLRRNPLLGRASESDLLQLVQLGEQFVILPGTSTLPIWKLRGFLILLGISLTLNILSRL
jgi:hypothetical protein